MAEIEILHYHPGSSPLHRLDPRLKALLMLIYITVILAGTPVSWSGTTVLLLIGSRSAGLHPLAFRRELKVFGFLGGVIFISRFLSAVSLAPPGTAVLSAGAAAWTFLLIVWLGILFTAVMNPVEFHSVIRWILRPIPGAPAGRLAAQASFTLVLLPRLLDAVHEIREARRARGIENRKNPLHRLQTLVYPLFEKLLMDMEEFSLALEARCYDENVVRIRFQLDRADLLWCGLFTVPAAAMLFLPYFL